MHNDENPQPEQIRPLSEQEGVTALSDWTAFRARYGANGAPAVLRAEQRAFLAGWIAGRHREEMRAADNE